MLRHLLSFTATFFSYFFNAIGTTLLGRISDLIFAGLVAVVALWRIRRDEGWRAMLNRWRRDYRTRLRFALWCSLIVYGPLAAYKFVQVIYDDHMTLVQRIRTQNGMLHLNSQEKIQIIADDAQKYNDLRVDCARQQGLVDALQSQNRDQQSSINNCQNQALKLLTPASLEFTLLTLGDNSKNNGHHVLSILALANKIVTPVRATVNCDKTIDSGSAVIVGNAAIGQPTSPPTATSFDIAIDSPAWGPKTPMLLNIGYIGQIPKCRFTEH